MTIRTATAVACAAILLAGCGGGAAASQNVNNIRVCGHYRTQRAHVKSLAEPSLTSALKFATWVAADAAGATHGTALARDLNDLSNAQQNPKSPQSSVYNSSRRVVKDCEALGVKFQP